MSTTRQSNFEILRILAILMVITGHFIRQSGLLESEVGINGFVNIILGSAGRIAVNVFLLIGAWFMVDMRFKPSKALLLYLQTAFYSIPITLLMLALGTAGETRNIIQGILPFFGRPVWFSSAYISLILLTPFLNEVFILPKKKLTLLTIALFIFFCVVSTIPSFSTVDYIADFSWFCVIYITIGWVKHTDVLSKLKINKWVALISGIAVYSALCMSAATKPLSRIANYWLDNIRTMPNLFCAFTIFFFFLKTDIGRIRLVNYFAKSVFAVYIVHQIPAFRLFLWKNICHANKLIGFDPCLYTLSIIGIAISILIAVTLLDQLRIFIFHKIEKRIEKGFFT